MKIAVIGTGNVGSALGGTLARAGHDVVFAARDAAKAQAVARDAGATAAASPSEAAAEADVVVLAVPFGSLEAVAGQLAPVTAGKVVIDVTNPLTPDFSGLATAGGASAAERLAEPLAGASVVKAFNTLFAGIQANPGAHGTLLDALYATDDEAAASTVAALAESIGFRPVRVGPLAAARELEAMAWLNIRLQLLDNGDWRTSYLLVAPPVAATGA